ncbi:uncharacterized protein LOC144663044 isoform X3 [Oculina patagonica]
MMERNSMRIHLFNCDNTYSLDTVEALLRKMEDKNKFKIAVDKRCFRLQQMPEICETIPQLQMDFAIFVVHAHESRLSINEDNAGIGYAKIYRTLLQVTGGKVLIVIGGDDQYSVEGEEERTVISRWARGQVASQFKEEYLDGRQSFIFSWNKQHRAIHEEALLHFFDPNKKGLKFVYQPKPKPKPEEPEITQPAVKDIPEEPAKQDAMDRRLPKDESGARNRGYYSEQEEQKRELRSQQKHATSYGAIAPVANVDYPANTVLLDTHMDRGKISYKQKHIRNQENNWKPSDKQVSDLMELHKATPKARVKFISKGNGGIHYQVDPERSCCCLF